MKKLSLLFLFFLISVFSLHNTQAQGLNFGIGGGFSFVQSPNYYTDYAGFSTEWHLGVKGKLDLPAFPITPIGFVEYHFLNGTTGTEDTKQNILSIGVGGEFTLLPGPLSPYLGLDFEFNNFGDFTPSVQGGSSGASRTGIGIGAGVMLNLILNIDVNLKYQMMNLFGKSDGEETVGILNLNASIFL
jgi:opacity protein-like surface antigen